MAVAFSPTGDLDIPKVGGRGFAQLEHYFVSTVSGSRHRQYGLAEGEHVHAREVEPGVGDVIVLVVAVIYRYGCRTQQPNELLKREPPTQFTFRQLLR